MFGMVEWFYKNKIVWSGSTYLIEHYFDGVEFCETSSVLPCRRYTLYIYIYIYIYI